MNIKKTILKHYYKIHKGMIISCIVLLFSVLLLLITIILSSSVILKSYGWVFRINSTVLISIIIIWFVVSKLMNKTVNNLRFYGKVIDQSVYKHKHPELFGDYLKIDDLQLSEIAFTYPLFVWTLDENRLLSSMLTEISSKNIPTLVLADDLIDDNYNVLVNNNDSVIDFKSEDSCGWDFCKDFKKNPKIIEQLQLDLFCDCHDYMECFKHSDVNDVETFLKILCLLPTVNTEQSLIKLTGECTEKTDEIRIAIAKAYECFSEIKQRKNKISLYDTTNIVWITNCSCNLEKFIINTAPDNTLCIIKHKHSHDVKRHKTIILNSSLEDFYLRFDGSYLYLGYDNRKVAELFGNTTVTNIQFAGDLYTNLNYEALANKDLECRFFRYYTEDDICRVK